MPREQDESRKEKPIFSCKVIVLSLADVNVLLLLAGSTVSKLRVVLRSLGVGVFILWSAEDFLF